MREQFFKSEGFEEPLDQTHDLCVHIHAGAVAEQFVAVNGQDNECVADAGTQRGRMLTQLAIHTRCPALFLRQVELWVALGKHKLGNKQKVFDILRDDGARDGEERVGFRCDTAICPGRPERRVIEMPQRHDAFLDLVVGEVPGEIRHDLAVGP